MFQFPTDAAPVSLETIPTIQNLLSLRECNKAIKWIGQATHFDLSPEKVAVAQLKGSLCKRRFCITDVQWPRSNWVETGVRGVLVCVKPKIQEVCSISFLVWKVKL